MTINMEKTVRELALENPAATRVFEKLGIDYCCGGGQTLEQACRTAAVLLERVMDSLASAGHTAATAPSKDWQTEPLADLIGHIKDTHHKFVREELARLTPLFDKVCSKHGQKHPELQNMRTTFGGLTNELTTHLMKEEVILFTYIERMEEASLSHEPVVPAPFGTVRNPVAMMVHEHDGAGDALRSLRQASDGYQAPVDACMSFRTLYQALAAFESDLHQHIHLENNILFPRAIAME